MLMEHEWVSRMNMADWEEVMKASKDYLFVIDQTKEGNHFSGTIIKKISDNNYKLNTKILYKESSITAPKCDVPVHCVHKNNVITESESINSTSEINITRKVDGSQTESVIYANRDWFNTLHGFTRMRIAEFEDEQCHPSQLIHALDFVDYMFSSDRYKKLSRASRYSAAADQYSVSYEEVRGGSIARVNIRRHCKDKW